VTGFPWSSTASIAAPRRWFDGFKTLKLIHFLRDHQLPDSPIFDAIVRIEPSCSGEVTSDLIDDLEAQESLLEHLRRRCAETDAER
jgi:hypothetical protein